MKKLLLILLGGLFLTTQTQAQSYLTEHGDTTRVSWVGTDLIEVHNSIKSASANPVKIKWRLVSSSLATGWQLSGFCDNNNCYQGTGAGGVLSGASFVSNNYYNTPYNTSTMTDVHTFDAQFSGSNTAPANTTSWVRMILKDDADTNNTASHRTLTFIAEKGTVGVSKVSVSGDNIVIFPNPAREAVNVIFDADAGIRSVAVYNLIGRAVRVYKTTGNSAKIDLNDVASGVYFLRLMNAQGQVVATRKFNHQ